MTMLKSGMVANAGVALKHSTHRRLERLRFRCFLGPAGASCCCRSLSGFAAAAGMLLGLLPAAACLEGADACA